MLKNFFSNQTNSHRLFIYSYLKLHSPAIFVIGTMVLLLVIYSQAAITTYVNYADSDDVVLAAAYGGLAHPPGYPLVIGMYHGLMHWFDHLSPLIVATTTTYILQVVAAGILMCGLLAWKIPGVLVAGLGLFWGLRYAPFLHATVPEIFAFNNLLLAIWVWLVGRIERRRPYQIIDYGVVLFWAGLMVFSHALLGIAVIGGGWYLIRNLPLKQRLLTFLGGMIVTLMLVMLWFFSYDVFSDTAVYTWPTPTTFHERWQFYWRKVYDPGGSQIETYVSDVSGKRFIHSLFVAGSHWYHDVTVVGAVLFILGAFLIVRVDASKRWLFFVWLLAGPIVALYLRFPYPSEVGYGLGTALRLRMFYVAELFDMFIIGYGLWWLYRYKPKLVTVGFAAFCLWLAVTRYPLFDASDDNFTSLWHQDLLTSLPTDSVLVVDSDEIFGLYAQHLLERVRPDVAIVPVRIPALDNSLDTMTPVWLVTAPEPEVYLSMLIASWLEQDKRVFLLSPGQDLISFLGLEANPFYAKPHGYVIEVSLSPPDYGNDYDYGLSVELARAPQHRFSWWLKGMTQMVGSIHVTHLYYFGINGFAPQANAHALLATSLMENHPQTLQVVAKTQQRASERFDELGPFILWEIPPVREYRRLAKEAMDRGQPESAYYFYTRALLVEPRSEAIHLELAMWHRLYGDAKWVSYHERQGEVLRLFAADRIGGE
jgi:hypothetical protein